MTLDDIAKIAIATAERDGGTAKQFMVFAALGALVEFQGCLAACEAVAEEHSEVWGLDGAAAAHECAARIRARRRHVEESAL